jgi:GNAT superfamily N-acetyltransferase
LRIYEHNPEELDEVLAFRNNIFTYVSVDHWHNMNCTAVVAREEGELVGFIPLQYRQQCLNARVTIPVAYENAVGVAEGRRGQGIGTRMIDEAAQFMRDRVDALMVIRGGERSIGYRFYRKSGHADLNYGCSYELPKEISWPAEDEGDIAVLERDQWLALEPDLLALYERQYGRYGGGQKRGPGYWRMILEGHVFREHQWWLVALTSDEGRLRGYLVGAWELHRSDGHAYVFEVVGEDREAVERLIRFAHRFDAGGGYRFAQVSLANPVHLTLRQMGFVASRSEPQVMARLLRPDRIFRRLAAGSNLVESLSLTVETPHRTIVVNEPQDPRYEVRLETKEGLLARLFCCRLDLAAAIETEMVRWTGEDEGLRREMREIFAFCDWVQWFTDFV